MRFQCSSDYGEPAGSRMALAIAVASAALASGCSGTGGPSGMFGGPPSFGGPGDRRAPMIFIAPSGKPFRAGPGEAYPTGAWFAAADLDRDGALGPEEFRRNAEAFFRELDLDANGEIDGPEIDNYEQRVAPEIRVAFARGMMSGPGGRPPGGDPPGGGMPKGGGMGGSGGGMGGGPRGSPGRGARRLANMPQGAGMFGLLNVPQPVTSADVDMNGVVTPAEFRSAADRRFRLLDTSKQGHLILASLPETPMQRMMGRRSSRACR